MQPISAIMSLNISVIGPNDTLLTAVRKMAQRNVSCLLVYDGNDPIGIVTMRDVLSKAIAYDYEVHEVRVQDVMTQPIVTFLETGSPLELFNIMAKHGIKQVPILNKEQAIVGIITQTDLVKAVNAWLTTQ